MYRQVDVGVNSGILITVRLGFQTGNRNIYYFGEWDAGPGLSNFGPLAFRFAGLDKFNFTFLKQKNIYRIKIEGSVQSLWICFHVSVGVISTIFRSERLGFETFNKYKRNCFGNGMRNQNYLILASKLSICWS